MEEDEDEYLEDLEYPGPYFEGPCTCDHHEDEHGWGYCDVEGCECEAGWTE